jgi:Tfp pilus assembly protein PilE
MNKQKYQSGFGAVEIIVIIAVVAVLGFVGWRVYESSQTKTQPAENQPNTEQATQPAEETHIVYKNKEAGYEFAYPKTWKTSDEAAKMYGSASTKYSTTLESPDLTTSNDGIGYHLVTGAQIYATVEPTEFTTAEAYYNRNSFLPRAAKDKKETTLDGVAALNYRWSWESTNRFQTVAIKDGKAYTVTLDYANEAALNAYKADFESVVASFKLP